MLPAVGAVKELVAVGAKDGLVDQLALARSINGLMVVSVWAVLAAAGAIDGLAVAQVIDLAGAVAAYKLFNAVRVVNVMGAMGRWAS